MKVFYDLQTGGYSAHTTIEGLAEMLSEELLIVISADENYEGEYEDAVKNWENPSEQQMRDIIEMYEYEILDPTEENIKAYEEYHDMEFR